MIGVLLALAFAGATPAQGCAFIDEPVSWTRGALEAWDRLDVERIRSVRPATPTLVLFGTRCAWTLSPDPGGDFVVGARRYSATGAAHEGQVALPDGGSVPARKLSFAFPTDQGPAFVMALPEVWRADANEARDPERLAMLVFMHEFAHTQQFSGLGGRIDDLIARGLPQDADDDFIQDTFGTDAEYRAAFERERDVFYEAGRTADPERGLTRLAEALELMRERQTLYLGGGGALLTEADEVFLTFEGSGNWAAWVWLTDPRGGAMEPEAAVEMIRGGGRFWSQDQGLAMAIVLDRLNPTWATAVFSDEPMTLSSLLVARLTSSKD